MTKKLNTDKIKETAIAALKKVYDPEIPINIYELGLIYEVKVELENKKIIIIMTLTSPNCPAADLIINEAEIKVSQLTGFQAFVDLTFDPPWDKEMMSEAAKLTLNMF